MVTSLSQFASVCQNYQAPKWLVSCQEWSISSKIVDDLVPQLDHTTSQSRYSNYVYNGRSNSSLEIAVQPSCDQGTVFDVHHVG